MRSLRTEREVCHSGASSLVQRVSRYDRGERVARNRSKENAGKMNSMTWAVKCRSCGRYSRYNEYYQKPIMHSGKVVSQAAFARCPKCGRENEYRSADLELIAKKGLTQNKQAT